MTKITTEEAEIIGALIGDGFIHKSNKYFIGFTGHPKNDAKYYEYILCLVKKVWNKSAKAKVRARGLRVAIYSKAIVERLVGLGLPYGERKALRVKIPLCIFNNWNLARATLRGIFDTDGTVFVADKRGSSKYPSIEVATSSIALAKQIKVLLKSKGFRTSNIWSYKSKNSTLTTHRLALNGKENLKKWLSDIGFSNPYKLKRALKYGDVAQPGRAH